MKTRHDWRQADPMTDAQIHQAALTDPGAQPLTPERLAGMKPTLRAKITRRALDLTQEEFAARFQIPLGTLRDWEQGVAQPDQTARLSPRHCRRRQRRAARPTSSQCCAGQSLGACRLEHRR
jgi:putative transcriptional regulator